MASAPKSCVPTRRAARSLTSRSLSHHGRRASDSVDSEPKSPRIVLRHGAIASLPTELSKLCLSFPLVVCSPSRLSLANLMRSLLPDLDTRIINSDAYPDSAMLSSRDSVISLGGPWAIAMARRISFELAIPHICVPTTHTGAAGDLPPRRKRNKDRSGSKKPQGDGDVQKHDESTGSPAVIIYDKEFTESRVKRFSAPSGVCENGDADADADAEAETDAGAVAVIPNVADDADSDASAWRPMKSSAAQWSYIHLPGV